MTKQYLPPAYANHRRNGRFFNPGVPEHGFRDLLKWVTHRQPGIWRQHIPSVPGPRPPECIEGSELRATFVNHSTVLLQTEGLNLLTDPVWSRRVSPVSFAGPERHRDPGIRFDDLPPIDCILISHNHYDHLDLPTLRKLARLSHPDVFCPLGLAPLLQKAGFDQIHELDWGQELNWKHLKLHCIPAQHFSSRTPFDRDRTLWCGWMVEADAGNIYFVGDSGFARFFPAVSERFQPIRLALIPIGAYDPEWFMGPIHMTPEQAVEVHGILHASSSMAIHFGTFSLADDGETAPLDRLNACLEKVQPDRPFWIPIEGEGRIISRP